MMGTKPYGIEDAKTEIQTLQANAADLVVVAGAPVAAAAEPSTHVIEIEKDGVTYYLLATDQAPA